MIEFPCHCSFRFKLQDDMAGAMIQCPRCGRLNDVPTLDDLQALDNDGTYKVDTLVIPDLESGHLDNLTRVYGPGRVDDEGESIDLRNTLDDVIEAGAEEIPLSLRDEVRPGAPKYDPVTGELVRPLDLKPAPPPSASTIPVARPAPLGYASGHTDGIHPVRVPFQLLMPGNAFVIFFIFAAHGLVWFLTIITVMGFFFMAPVLLVFLALIVAHYGNIIDDIGPGEQDELPRPLRGLSFYDDIWHPSTAMLGSLFICYGPAWVVTYMELPWPELHGLIVLGMMALGTLLLPAVMLTTTTSGSAMNLAPHRVLGVMFSCGIGYLFAVVLAAAALVVYAAGLGFLPYVAFRLGFDAAVVNTLTRGVVLFPLLLLGIYLVHLYCWELGLLYRRHYPRFPWVLQRHEWSPREPVPPRRPRPPQQAPQQPQQAQPDQARQRMQQIARNP
jgi:hypothetical protein